MYKNPDEQRRYMREWIRRRREAWFAENGPCARCGSEEDLLLHHRDPTKKVSHRIWSWSEKRRLEELAKCVVLCRKCHDAVHHPLVHGAAGYKRGCRCQICRAAQTARQRAYRRRLRNELVVDGSPL